MSREDVCNKAVDFGGLSPERLERISLSVECLQLWVKQMLADDKIDRKKYEYCLNSNK